MSEPNPAWVECEDCENPWCTIHDMHAHDCDCPAIEDWDENGVDPYSEGGPSNPGVLESSIHAGSPGFEGSPPGF
jgi:hypothetical protein